MLEPCWNHDWTRKDTFIRWSAPRKNHPTRAERQCILPKAFVERLCDFKNYAISVLSFVGSVLRTRQDNPQGRKQCPSVYNRKPIPRYTV